MKQDLIAEVTLAQAGFRADQAAAELFPEYSRSQLSRWIQRGFLLVDGVSVKPRQRLLGGETLALQPQAGEVVDWNLPQDVSFDILYEDEWILIVNKPAGLVVHPGAGNPDRTLVNGLLARYPELVEIPRAGLVHRLDKDTTGLMVVARSHGAHTQLGAQILARSVKREYFGIAEGKLSGGVDVDRPLGRDPADRRRRKVVLNGKVALTKIRVKARYRAHTAITASLETGRTHQIRVHMASLGHVLVGDRVYRARGVFPPGASASLIHTLQAFPRQALHAERLGLIHPGSKKFMEFDIPLPDDLAQLASQLAEDAAQNHD